jgi:hypothetical protein
VSPSESLGCAEARRTASRYWISVARLYRMLRRFIQSRLLGVCCAVLTTGVLAVMGAEWLWGADWFGIGWEADVVFIADLTPERVWLRLEVYGPANWFYCNSSHRFIAVRCRGEPSGLSAVQRNSLTDDIRTNRYWLCGRQRKMKAGQVDGTSYWVEVPWLLPIAALCAAAGLAWSIRRRRRTTHGAGFPMIPAKQDMAESG